MRRASLIPMLLALGALALAGCGSDNSSSDGSSGGGSTSTPATTGGGGGGVAIAMRDIQFDPTGATAKVGQKVTWTNDDSVDHNVTSQSGETIDSGNFGQGQTFSFTPTKAGTINYVCTLHPGMTGKLVVTK